MPEHVCFIKAIFPLSIKLKKHDLYLTYQTTAWLKGKWAWKCEHICCSNGIGWGDSARIVTNKKKSSRAVCVSLSVGVCITDSMPHSKRWRHIRKRSLQTSIISISLSHASGVIAARDSLFFLWVVKIRLGSGILSPVVAHVQCVSCVTHRQRIINMRRQYVDPSRIFFVCSQLIFELKSIFVELYPNWLIFIDCVASR